MSPATTRVVRSALAALLGVTAFTPVRAEETGGILSPFAHGAGGRALGMGGAFVAAADDATSLMWNPGGLARVSRYTYEVGFAQLAQPGAAEHFAAFALPSWRWGTAGLALHHVGTGGIEQRDDRNQLLPGSIDAGETEVALGYGRSLVDGIGLGLALKLQRVGVGNLAGTGYGADVGLAIDAGRILGERWAWTTPFTVGLAARNLVEPYQTLVRDPVSDPRVVRAGLGWRRPFGTASTLQLAADLEHSLAASRLRTGAELNLAGVLGLRAGLDGGNLSAGTSVRWRELRVDYVFEQHDVSTVHRIGVTQAIGPTTSERRRAFHESEERALATRLERAFEVRRREQIAALLGRGEQALAAARYDEAMETAVAARALAPDEPRAIQLEAAALRAEGARLERAGDPAGASLAYSRALAAWPADSAASTAAKRARAEIARRASRANLTREIEAAYRAYGAGDLDAARTAFRHLHEVAPEDSASASMLRRIEQAIAQRLVRRLAQVRRDLEAGLLDEAQAGIAESRTLGARDADLATLRTELEAQRMRLRDSPAPPPAATHGPTEAQRREADVLFRRGLSVASAGQPEGAIRLWELAFSLDPDHRGVREALKREFLLRGMEAFGHGRFNEAERHWSRVIELDPADTRARAYLDQAREKIERTRELTGEGR